MTVTLIPSGVYISSQTLFAPPPPQRYIFSLLQYTKKYTSLTFLTLFLPLLHLFYHFNFLLSFLFSPFFLHVSLFFFFPFSYFFPQIKSAGIPPPQGRGLTKKLGIITYAKIQAQCFKIATVSKRTWVQDQQVRSEKYKVQLFINNCLSIFFFMRLNFYCKCYSLKCFVYLGCFFNKK